MEGLTTSFAIVSVAHAWAVYKAGTGTILRQAAVVVGVHHWVFNPDRASHNLGCQLFRHNIRYILPVLCQSASPSLAGNNGVCEGRANKSTRSVAGRTGTCGLQHMRLLKTQRNTSVLRRHQLSCKGKNLTWTFISTNIVAGRLSCARSRACCASNRKAGQ